MSKWILKRTGADYDKLSKELGIDKVLIRIMLNRGINTMQDMKEFITRESDMIYKYNGLPDIKKAVDIIYECRSNASRLRIVGDYDIDGVCSTAILLKGMNMLGIEADYYIPDRIADGYGLNENIIKKAIEDKISYILTCDNGITAVNEIKLAKDSGIKVIVTDHHNVLTDEKGDEILPQADAIVNPKRMSSTYPETEICGAYVAFKLMVALFERYKEEGEYDCAGEPDTLLTELSDLAAFATIGDIMPLLSENRALVYQGLLRLKNCTNPGLKKLIEKRNLLGKTISVYHVGFVLGPCINATGRLKSADDALRLLMCNGDEADEIADRLIELNEERKLQTEKSENAAINLIEDRTKKSGGELLDKVLVIYLKDCHESIAGIIAGRIKERYLRPVICFTDSSTEGILKGSARSIEEYNMIEHINQFGNLLVKYGGHKLAAGLSIKESNLREFTDSLNDNAELTQEDFVKKVYIDAVLPLENVNFQLIEELGRLEPYGTGNAKPVFAIKNVRFIKGTIYEKTKKFGKYKGMYNNIVYDFIMWNVDDFNEFIKNKFGDEEYNKLYSNENNYNSSIEISLIYVPEINEFRGQRSIQFTISDYC